MEDMDKLLVQWNYCLPSGKYLVWLWQGYDRLVICNDKGEYYLNSEKEAYNHLLCIKEDFKRLAIEYNYPITKVNNLKLEVKQIA